MLLYHCILFNKAPVGDWLTRFFVIYLYVIVSVKQLNKHYTVIYCNIQYSSGLMLLQNSHSNNKMKGTNVQLHLLLLIINIYKSL